MVKGSLLAIVVPSHFLCWIILAILAVLSLVWWAVVAPLGTVVVFLYPFSGWEEKKAGIGGFWAAPRWLFGAITNGEGLKITGHG